MEKPLHKNIWFYIFIVIALSIIGLSINNTISKNRQKKIDEMKISFSKGDYVDFDFKKEAEYFDSRVNGNVTIKGKTKPNSKVGLEDYTTSNKKYNAKTISDNKGYFIFKFNLGHNMKGLSGWITAKKGKYSDSSMIYIQNNDSQYQSNEAQKKAQKKAKKEQEQKNKVKKSTSSNDAYLASLKQYVTNGSTNDLLPAISVKLDGEAGVEYTYDADKFNSLSYEEKILIFKELENHTDDIANLCDKPMPSIQIVLNNSLNTIAVQRNLRGGITVN